MSGAIVASRVVSAEKNQCRSALAHANCRFAGEQVQRADYIVPMCAKPESMECQYFAGLFAPDVPVYDASLLAKE